MDMDNGVRIDCGSGVWLWTAKGETLGQLYRINNNKKLKNLLDGRGNKISEPEDGL